MIVLALLTIPVSIARNTLMAILFPSLGRYPLL